MAARSAGVTFDGNMNTGLTLRTIRMKDGVGEVRAGATLLYDSDPQAEEAECRLKASAMFAAIRGKAAAAAARRGAGAKPGAAAGCCWSTTRIRSSTRWPTTSARPAPRS